MKGLTDRELELLRRGCRPHDQRDFIPADSTTVMEAYELERRGLLDMVQRPDAIYPTTNALGLMAIRIEMAFRAAPVTGRGA